MVMISTVSGNPVVINLIIQTTDCSRLNSLKWDPCVSQRGTPEHVLCSHICQKHFTTAKNRQGYQDGDRQGEGWQLQTATLEQRQVKQDIL